MPFTLQLSTEQLLLCAMALLALMCFVLIVVALQANRRTKEELVLALERFRLEEREQAHANTATLTERFHRDIQAISNEIKTANDTQWTNFTGLHAQNEKNLQDSLMRRFNEQGLNTQTSLEAIRNALNTQLQTLKSDNDKALERMRSTVEEKLQETLNTRISQSFKTVEEQLNAVFKGLGEMRQMASNLDGLKRVLANVKTRGTFGELQLKSLLSQMLSPEQYVENAATRPKSTERVEFAVRLPGPDGEGSVLLPIDSKFPLDDFERLESAQDAGDVEAMKEHAAALERRIVLEAKKIHEKYVEVPYTTEFAVLYLPTESLFAEVLKRPGLLSRLQQECRVSIAGPTVLAALLNSLQMGFRTLAIEKKSSEVWQLLGEVKTQFIKFSDAINTIENRVESVQKAIGDVKRRTNVMGKRLRDVEAIDVAAQPIETISDTEQAPLAPDLNP